MKGQEELGEVDGPTLVRIKSSESVLAELFSVPPGKHLTVH